jgi:hypothetical protein
MERKNRAEISGLLMLSSTCEADLKRVSREVSLVTVTLIAAVQLPGEGVLYVERQEVILVMSIIVSHPVSYMKWRVSMTRSLLIISCMRVVAALGVS